MCDSQKLQFLNKLIYAIYQTTLNPSVLSNDVLCHLSQLLHLSTASALNHDLNSKQAAVFSFTGLFDKKAALDYQQYYGKKTPAINNTIFFHEGNLFTERCLPNYEQYIKSETYQDFFKKYESEHMLLLVTQRQQQVSQYLSLRRSASAGHFTNEEILTAQYLTPHLVQASKIATQLQSHLIQIQSLEQAFEKMSMGIVVYKNKEVIFVNHSADKLLRKNDGLSIQQNQLFATQQSDALLIQSEISRALSKQAIQAVYATLSISRRDGKRPYQINITPLHETTVLLDQTDHYVMVSICDPEKQMIREAGVLASLYGLTEKEAEVVKALCNGYSVTELALMFQTKANTIRFHLKNIYLKLNITSQSELISLVLKGPIFQLD